MATKRIFSVVIPTLQRAPELERMAVRCAEHPRVLEVLIVNNSPRPLEWATGRIRVLQQETNIFVNPAWNLGAASARGDVIVLMNDDIEFDTSIFDRAARWMRLPFVGIVGPAPSCLRVPQERHVVLRPTFERTHGFGTLMFVRRSDYVPVPADLLIFFGDDWLLQEQARPNWSFWDFPIRTEMAATSGEAQFSDLLQQDAVKWRSHRRARMPHLRRATEFMLRQLARTH